MQSDENPGTAGTSAPQPTAADGPWGGSWDDRPAWWPWSRIPSNTEITLQCNGGDAAFPAIRTDGSLVTLEDARAAAARKGWRRHIITGTDLCPACAATAPETALRPPNMTTPQPRLVRGHIGLAPVRMAAPQPA